MTLTLTEEFGNSHGGSDTVTEGLRFDRWAQEQFAVHGGEVLATGTWRSIRLLASVFNWKFKAVKNYLLNQYIVHNKSPIEPPWYHLFK